MNSMKIININSFDLINCLENSIFNKSYSNETFFKKVIITVLKREKDNCSQYKDILIIGRRYKKAYCINELEKTTNTILRWENCPVITPIKIAVKDIEHYLEKFNTNKTLNEILNIKFSLKREFLLNEMKENLLITMIKDEDDILDYWIRHHKQIFNKNIVILNNESIDESHKIIKKYEIKSLIVKNYKEKGFYISKIIELMNGFNTFNIPLDVDEFLFVKNDNKLTFSNVNKVLCLQMESLDEDKVIKVKTLERQSPAEGMCKHLKLLNIDNKMYNKSFFYGLPEEYKKLDIGNHMPRCKHIILSDLVIVHLPYRSNKQILKKCINNLSGLGYDVSNKKFEYWDGIIKKNKYSPGNQHIRIMISYLQSGEIKGYIPNMGFVVPRKLEDYEVEILNE